MKQHLVCAAAELALDADPAGPDAALFGPQLPRLAAALRSRGLLAPHPHSKPGAPGLLYYSGPNENATRGVTLRTIDPEHVSIVNEANKEVIEQV